MTSDPRALERVREELRRLGYLDHGFERFLLQDALKPRPAGRTLLRLAAKVALLAGVVLALLAAFALAAANGSLAASPFDLVPLFLHLLLPISFAAGVGFLALCAVLVLALRLYHLRRIEAFSLGAALVVGAATLALALFKGRELSAEMPMAQRLVAAVVTSLVVLAVVRVVYQGLLSLAVSLTDMAPRGRPFSRRRAAAVILLVVFVLTLPGLLGVRRPPVPQAPASIPTAPGERALLVGVDGVLPAELDYLLGRGELPVLAGLLEQGGVLVRYRRPADLSPAVFWTSVATGLPDARHGVTALETFRPLGTVTPLARTGPSRFYWSRVAEPLGLAEHRPLLQSRRHAFAVWELAGRGGAPAVAINWWGTFPAEATHGLVLAHGAYQLLAEGVPEVVAPESLRPEIERLHQEIAAGTVPAARGLPPTAAESVVPRALAPDRFYRAVLARAMDSSPRLAALYLPAADIAADGWRWGPLLYGDLVRAELAALDETLAEVLDGVGTVALVFDPGRRGGGEGRVILWRGRGCSTSRPLPAIRPQAVASALLRAVGLPQSGELPPPPPVCRWRQPPAELATFGERIGRRAQSLEGEQYLESLRSLGYL